MMRRLTSAPKPGGAGGDHHLGGGGGVDPQAVAHAVEAGQVARRLGRGDQVVGREAVGDGRDRHLLHRGAGGGQGVGGLADPGGDVGVDALAHQLGDHADPEAVDAVVEVVGRSPGAAWGIEVESAGSWPAMTSSSEAASATVAANGPIWSSDEAKATSP